MNLENLNLVELNAQEVQSTDGGVWYHVAGWVIGAAIATYDAISDMHEGYVEAYNQHHGKK